jgi:hypothetical protein
MTLASANEAGERQVAFPESARRIGTLPEFKYGIGPDISGGRLGILKNSG